MRLLLPPPSPLPVHARSSAALAASIARPATDLAPSPSSCLGRPAASMRRTLRSIINSRGRRGRSRRGTEAEQLAAEAGVAGAPGGRRRWKRPAARQWEATLGGEAGVAAPGGAAGAERLHLSFLPSPESCFYFTVPWSDKLLVIDALRMEFSIVNDVPSGYCIRGRGHGQPRAVLGAKGIPLVLRGLYSFAEGTSELKKV
ncbi:unnamed protein product [Urochloa humidicola]